jgi:hypothetical protein
MSLRQAGWPTSASALAFWQATVQLLPPDRANDRVI